MIDCHFPDRFFYSTQQNIFLRDCFFSQMLKQCRYKTSSLKNAHKHTYVQKCMQWRKWRNWRKIASRWRFELDAKSGPLEAGDFGEIGDFGKNRHACNGEKSPASGDLNWMPKVAPWRLAILVKMAILVKLAILAKITMHAMAKITSL